MALICLLPLSGPKGKRQPLKPWAGPDDSTLEHQSSFTKELLMAAS